MKKTQNTLLLPFLFLLLILSACGPKTANDQGTNTPPDTASDSHSGTEIPLPDTSVANVPDTLDEVAMDSLPEVASDTQSFQEAFARMKKVAKTKDYDSFGQYIHPDLGFYHIYRPGATLAFPHFQKLDQEWRVVNVRAAEVLKNISQMNVRYEAWPSYVDCGEDGFSKDGCFASFPENFRGLSELHEFLQTQFSEEELGMSAADISNYKQLESLVRVSVILTTPDKVIMHFLWDKGQWYLGIVDVGHFDCDA